MDGVDLVLLRTEAGKADERTELQGLAAAVAAEPAGEVWRVSGGLGSPGAPLDLAAHARPRRRAAVRCSHARLWLSVSATASEARAAL